MAPALPTSAPYTFIIGDVGSSPTPTVKGVKPAQVMGELYFKSSPVTAPAVDLPDGHNADHRTEFQGRRESRRQGRKRMQCVLAGRFLGDGREGQHFRREHSGAYQRHAGRRRFSKARLWLATVRSRLLPKRRSTARVVLQLASRMVTIWLPRRTKTIDCRLGV